MNRTFDITLDIQKPIDPQNSFRFFRGDNVFFNFVYKNGDADFPTTDASKLRVYAKKVYARGVSPDEQPLFASESTTISSVSFSSSSTSGDAGNYLMAVILLDANNNLITAQGIFFDLIENGYAGVYQPGEDFRDEVLDALAQAQAAAQSAQTAATNSANSATEAAGYKTSAAESAGAASSSAQASAQSETNAASSASSAQTSAMNAAKSEADALASKNAAEAAAQIAQETDAGALMLSKLGAGQLWFDRGVLSVPSFANLSISLPISLCIEYDVDSWSGFGSTTNGGIMFLATRDVEYTTPAQFKGFYLRYYEDKSLSFHCANADSTPLTAQFSALTTNGGVGLPTGRHTLVVCVGGEISGGRPSHFAWYLDGLALSQAITQQTMTAPDITSTRPLAVAQADNYSNPPLVGGAKVPVRLSRAKIFNFLMDAEGSPYTVADYAAGKPVPPKLYDPAAAQRALLALEDYTIARNTTTRLVKDVSGNAYDATVVESGGSGDTAWTGTVKGARDTAVAAFVDEIKTQFTQSQG